MPYCGGKVVRYDESDLARSWTSTIGATRDERNRDDTRQSTLVPSEIMSGWVSVEPQPVLGP
jgi:hypothetical protein